MIDPYGQYHTERRPYGTRPLANEPHIIIEYRELIPQLDKEVVRRLRSGFYLPRHAPAEAEEQSDIVDSTEAAVAAAAASAASAALDAANKSGAVVDRLLEEDFNAKVDAARKNGNGACCHDEDILGTVRYSIDRVCLEPMDDDSDDESMASIALNMANTTLSFKRHHHRSQIPQDYLDLQRHFAAQHPYQSRPLSIERDDGTVVSPSEKHFKNGETIVFREFAMEACCPKEEEKSTLGQLEFTASGRRTLPLVHKKPRPFDWERGYAEWASSCPHN